MIANVLKLKTITLMILMVVWLATGPARATDTHPTVDQLLEQFETVVFDLEMGPGARANRVIRWEKDLLVRIVGRATRLNKKILRRHSNTVERMTGRAIKYVSGVEQVETVTVAFLPPLEMANLPGVVVDQKMLDLLAAPRGCYFLVSTNTRGEITRSIIVVNADRDTASIYHCLLEELVQSMGLPNDTNLIRPSIFSDHDQLRKVTRSDEVLVRTLYDPRIAAGMTKSEAMGVARMVISDWNDRIPLR
jgi:hypothetical protein